MQCNDCDHQVTQTSGFKLHLKEKHEGNTYQCNHCYPQTTHKSKLVKHIHIKHSIRYNLVFKFRIQWAFDHVCTRPLNIINKIDLINAFEGSPSVTFKLQQQPALNMPCEKSEDLS